MYFKPGLNPLLAAVVLSISFTSTSAPADTVPDLSAVTLRVSAAEIGTPRG